MNIPDRIVETKENNYTIPKIVGYPIAGLTLLLDLVIGGIAYRKVEDLGNIHYSYRIGIFMMGVVIVAISMLLIILEQNAEDRSRRILFGIQITSALDLLLCILYYCVNNTFMWGICLLTFFASPIICLLFWIYQRIICFGNHFKAKRIDNLIIAFFTLDCLLLTISAAGGKLYEISEEGIYRQGPWSPFSFIYPLIVLVFCIYFNLSNEMSLRKHITCITFAFCPLCFAVAGLITQNTIFGHLASVFGVVVIYGGIYIERERTTIMQREELQKTRIEAALLQINPHFIQNCLTSIRGLMYIDVKESEEMLLDLAGYLRGTFTSLSREEFISVREEMKLTDFYLAIEQKRFPDSIVVNKDIDSYDSQIPSFIIEPLVENAVRHGIREKEGTGCITISVKETPNLLEIKVIDDGVGFDAEKAFDNDREHIGLYNVKRRIELMAHGSLTMKSEIGKGTEAVILIPRKEGNNESIDHRR